MVLITIFGYLRLASNMVALAMVGGAKFRRVEKYIFDMKNRCQRNFVGLTKCCDGYVGVGWQA